MKLSKEESVNKMSNLKKVAILINGGDAPGLNAVIRAIVNSARENGIECYGFIEGFKGLLENNYIRLDNLKLDCGTSTTVI